MKQHLETLLADCIDALQRDGRLPPGSTVAVHVQRARDPQHGHFASNVAMALAKLLGRPPRDVAQEIVSHLAPSPRVASVSVAGPGFINFRLAPLAFHQVVQEILASGEAFGRCDIGRGQRVCLEFVSANPTGPLHVGHGRGAAYGAALAAVLEAGGFQVHREYYVNDAGRQMDILAASVWLRYLELCGETLPFPANGYRGDYVYDIAADLHRSHGSAFHRAAGAVLQDLPPDADAGGDKERYIDALIARAKGLLGPEDYRRVFDCGLNVILADIRNDLEQFGVRYDEWFSERNLLDSGAVEQAIGRLREAGQLYQRDAALWFRSSALGDEKDRVLVRDNGQLTYFATDIAYHLGKLARGFERLIDIWGADHHGYVPRLKAALAALSEAPDALEVLLVQFAVLYRGGEKVQMSTRSGDFVTLRELRQEVGGDAARFFYVMRKSDQHLDFDLDLAKSRTADNPVYYIQYAHARIASVMRQLAERGLAWDQQQGGSHLGRLSEPHEEQLLLTLSRYPEVIETAVRYHEPHQVAHYLRELANDFHTYYNAHTFLVNDPALRDARLCLINAAGQVIRNGLALLGVAAPVTM